MCRILPRKQNLLPVCLKRKLEYTGNYLEEIIDRNKVNAYFNFFKRFNPLFNKEELKDEKINDFENDCSLATEDFEEALSKVDDIEISTSENQDASSESSNNDFDDPTLNSFFNPEEENHLDESTFFRDQTSVFCNKYEEDVNVPTVANNLANMIVEAETHFNVEIVDEIENEEIQEIEQGGNEELGKLVGAAFLEDEVFKEKDFLEDILESDMQLLEETAEKINDDVLKKMKKISVAPGETGQFKNWGEEVFLEEQAFPELFPFGCGGYLSSLIDNKENDMGFAMYVKHRILSADPKYRKNSAYLFFLLIVKELVQLKRCKQTYLRQATKLPNLSKETLKNVKHEDLSRYNRSYQVFKTMRGTSMFYEEAKKNVMAILRQNGSPSLFVTLSCAEYSWDGLLKEILGTVLNKEASDEDVKKLSSQERNRLISENVIQSTLHFQKRIEKELKLMTMPNFLNNDCKYSVSSYYYRVEYQQRGAPHIHCLLWLKDNEGNDAPTFWSSDNEDETEETQKDKMNEIEKIATMLISASDESALCEDHWEELQLIKEQSSMRENCLICNSAEANFEECSEHKISMDIEDCIKCQNLQQLVEKFQTHKHTFTCQKKNKTITVRSHEGHGKNDDILEGPTIRNYVHCRFNFPQFPLNKTTFILGMSKTLDPEIISNRKKDLQKINKFLIRNTYSEDPKAGDSLAFQRLKSLSFIQFLYEVGMFEGNKDFDEHSEEEKQRAYDRYIHALSASVKGTGSVFLKRETKDLFTNNYNRKLMDVHKANHDIQMVVDQVN